MTGVTDIAMSEALTRAVPATETEFADFVRTRRERAIRVAFRLLGGDQGAAEDVAQNAFVRAHRALSSFRGEASIDTWFYRIVVREAERQRRWSKVRRLWSLESPGIEEPADERPAGDPGLRKRIAAALERLSATQREVFVLVHLEQVTVEDTARILGKATGTVKSHLHRALATLRHELADLARAEASEGSPS